VRGYRNIVRASRGLIRAEGALITRVLSPLGNLVLPSDDVEVLGV
jgi:hypothetical protein